MRKWIHWLSAFALGLTLACSDTVKENEEDGGTSADLYAGLWDVALGQVKCNKQSCCIKRCGGNQDTVCVTRDSAAIIASLKDPSAWSGCSDLVFPEWFYNYDCFVGVGGVVNPITGKELKFVDNEYHPGSKQLSIGFLQCFCGRAATTYSSEYSTSAEAFRVDSCDQPLVGIDLTTGEEGFDESIVACDNPCNTCQPRCGDRQCGSDGCGGTCAPGCAPGKTCTAVGQCASEQDTCSSCLGACRGLPGCCTGCGCICESACGQCF